MKYMIRAFFAVLIAIAFSLSAAGQPPPPGDHGGDEDQQPAPIGSGMVILLALGAAYGAKKVYTARKKELRG